MSELDALLKEWARLEPNRCEDKGDHFMLRIRDKEFVGYWPLDEWQLTVTPVQIALQDAIVERKLRLTVDWFPNWREWRAQIYDPMYHHFLYRNKSHVVALLSVYLTYLTHLESESNA